MLDFRWQNKMKAAVLVSLLIAISFLYDLGAGTLEGPSLLNFGHRALLLRN